ncbi:hypothetical protein LCGC14_2136580 [marine sediment metagenome]|uniref:Uncharacterized protein n=1 Tax=marine sediment metagenome TaxID=412755 RepID=A0A0F9EM21_9ZZZZ
MFIEVKREITIISHYNEMESHLIYKALNEISDKISNSEEEDCVLSILAEMQTTGDKVQALLNMEKQHNKGRKD